MEADGNAFGKLFMGPLFLPKFQNTFMFTMENRDILFQSYFQAFDLPLTRIGSIDITLVSGISGTAH